MIIIGFTAHTSKILPRILCRRFRHCAVIVPKGGDLILHQFVRRGSVVEIKMRARDLGVLRAYGWHFIFMPIDMPGAFDATRARTCVDLAKLAIGMHAWHIQTPYGLYRKIRPMGGFFNHAF